MSANSTFDVECEDETKRSKLVQIKSMIIYKETRDRNGGYRLVCTQHAQRSTAKLVKHQLLKKHNIFKLTMSLNLETEETNILYLPLKDEKLPNLTPHTTLKQSEHPKIADLATATFDVVTGITKLPYSPSFLSELCRVLKPGGIVMIQIGKESQLKKTLLYSGFVDIESKQRSEINHWTARKPKIEIKAAPLKPLKSKIKSNVPDNSNKGNVWSLGMNDMMDDDIDIVDEDTLLDHEEEKVVIPKTAILDDCGTGIGSSRKPCKNCSCGRAEKKNDGKDGNQKKEKETVKIYDAKTSSCGSCHLGDAFRCSGCPYLGMPAFDPDSETVKLQLD